MHDNPTWCYADTVLKAATLKTLAEKLSRQGVAIVDGWAASNPKELKRLEASGELVAKALATQNQGAEIIAQAHKDGFSHLADHEIYEMVGGPNLKL